MTLSLQAASNLGGHAHEVGVHETTAVMHLNALGIKTNLITVEQVVCYG